MTTALGIPDHSAVPSVLQNYQATFTITPTAGCADGWSFEMSLLPHPINFMYWATHDSITATNTGTLLNPQLAGTSHGAKYNSLVDLAQRWRLAYMSATVYQDGPDLANQGTIVAAQHAVAARNVHFSLHLGGLPQDIFGACDVNTYTDEDKPDYTTAEAMPNAYFTKSKEGCYMPLKLTETCQDWVSDAHAVGLANTRLQAAHNVWSLSNPGVTHPWPHCTGNVGDLDEVVVDVGLGNLAGQRTSPMLSGNVGQICARNLSSATRYAVFIRCGIELQVHPTSVLSPQMHLSPVYDSQALSTYYAIARDLKDAYPASYNSAGKIWDQISKVANAVLPTVAKLGIPIASPLAAGLKGVVGLGDFIRNENLKDQRPANKPKPKKQQPQRRQQPKQKQPKRRPQAQSRNVMLMPANATF